MSELDAAAWDALTGDADVYFTRDYHELCAAGESGQPRCFAAQSGQTTLLMMGLARPAAPAVFDLQSCNGYGGPYLIAPSPPPREELEAMWQELAATYGIVAAFFRLHPLLGNERWLPHNAMIRPDRKTVFLDARLEPTELWERASSRHRNMVRKAARLGVGVRWNAEEDWLDFPALYAAAMERLGAVSSLRFGRWYFEALAESSFADLAAVRSGGVLLAAAIVLHGPRWAHYHLACRAPGVDNSLSNALLEACVAHTRERGLEGLHLGGGRTPAPDDSLLKFKTSLGGDLLDYRVARVIFDKDRFDRLTEEWTARSGRAGSWLLPYREPVEGSP